MAATLVGLVDLEESLKHEPRQAACMEELLKEAQLERELGGVGSQEVTRAG